MSPFYCSARAKLTANDSGQAMVEFAFIVPLLLIMMCAAIDFGRALYTMQVVAQLTRQGSSLSSRINTCSGAGTVEPMETLTCSTQAVIAGESGLNIASYGKVIMTAVQNTAADNTKPPVYQITGQYSQGGLSATSKVGSTVGGTVTPGNTPGIPAVFAAGNTPLQAGQTMYITEIFYQFTAATPIGALTNNAINMPTALYNVAYF
ncbi:TadE/TadG family type IV pilus assembly protein [Candidatus Binatus sp.]|uniref:TadE/TadG family type IV pilus assembly protein n=1 Tax=Candidatus Binatus sp. TaxID=2811406 RepID=UPI002F949D94